MQIEVKHNCPMNGFTPCRQFECAWFAQVRGHNINTGKDVDEWACAVSWIPALTLEVAGQARQTGAAVESLRNEVIKANEETKQQGPMIPFAPLLARMMQPPPVPLPPAAPPKALES